MARIWFRATLLFTLFPGLTAIAQFWQPGPTYVAPPPGEFSHIVFIIQENRTPDTLFGGSGFVTNPPCGGWNGFAPGVDLANGGLNASVGKCTSLQTWPDLECGGGDHSHTDWVCEYNGGALNGACGVPTSSTCTAKAIGANCGQTNPTCANGEAGPAYSPYIAVAGSTSGSVVYPYITLAKNYGWANYMFQTNQGPSYPAHQFLFSGTSAGTWPGTQYSDYFISENPGLTGCDGNAAPNLDWIDPTGVQHKVSTLTGLPTLLLDGYSCYDHNTLVTTSPNPSSAVTPSGSVTWRYYAQTAGTIWNAPESLTQICYSQNAIATGSNGLPVTCGTNSSTLDEYANVKLAGGTGLTNAPILTDIANCKLQGISWVTPDGAWSDHPGDDPNDKGQGPIWVADIVNAIGKSAANSGGVCDYWGNSSSDGANTKIEPTAIFILWDDWGGFYDHVPPPAVNNVGHNANCANTQPPWGCGYTYGFRVPLVVVSEYTKPGTVSGALISNAVPTSYANIPPAWEHDFGSLLKFAENNFSLPPISTIDGGYADSNTFDATYKGQSVVPLWDFFYSYPTTFPFTTVPAALPASYFENYYSTIDPETGLRHIPRAPDNDGDED